jgi:hypothetical protein
MCDVEKDSQHAAQLSDLAIAMNVLNSWTCDEVCIHVDTHVFM